MPGPCSCRPAASCASVVPVPPRRPVRRPPRCPPPRARRVNRSYAQGPRPSCPLPYSGRPPRSSPCLQRSEQLTAHRLILLPTALRPPAPDPVDWHPLIGRVPECLALLDLALKQRDARALELDAPGAVQPLVPRYHRQQDPVRRPTDVLQIVQEPAQGVDGEKVRRRGHHQEVAHHRGRGEVVPVQ